MAYLPLSTANLPDPAIDPAQGSSPSDYFNTVLWTGNGASTIDITGVGFQPDFVWAKARSRVDGHGLFDAVRGTNLWLQSNTTGAETTFGGNFGLLSFDSDGYTMGNGSSVNASGATYVGWNWKANGSGVSNTDGSITSTVSANTTSGFSVVKYDGSGTAATVGHGLNQAPEMIFCKRLDRSGDDWKVYAEAIGGGTHQLTLNSTAAASTNSAQWNDTDATSTVFSIGTSAATNGTNQIAYCFHSVEGFSKFVSYTGNGSADGPFVYTGFRPAFVMIRKTSGDRWFMGDSTRSPTNTSDGIRLVDASGVDAEFANSPAEDYDMLSNGFKINTSDNGVNTSGSTYIYMAFAENPFKYSNAR